MVRKHLTLTPTWIPDIINFVVPPNIGYGLTVELVNQGYNNFWYQPGAESKEISNFLTLNKKNYIIKFGKTGFGLGGREGC